MSGSIRAATLPILLAGACGAFCLSVMPQALQLLVRDRAYRSASNILYVIVGALASLATISVFALVVFAVVLTAISTGFRS
nr:putative integron gene cassette protein [uncultured bacterium]